MFSRTLLPCKTAAQPLVLDFLAPSLYMSGYQVRRHGLLPSTSRNITTVKSLDSHRRTYSDHASNQPLRIPRSGNEAAKRPAPLSRPLTKAQRDFLDSALRVNHAGELAATLIYTAQTPLLIASHPHLRPVMKHMYDQEAGHFKTFSAMLAKHRVRPTVLYPVWSLAASVLGWSTALMGREAAMACTEAVETEIGGHYNGQVRILLDMVEKMEQEGEEVGEELKSLVDTIRRIRDEELEHLDHAVENDAQKAVPHAFLTNVIRSGCKGAIWISERV